MSVIAQIPRARPLVSRRLLKDTEVDIDWHRAHIRARPIRRMRCHGLIATHPRSLVDLRTPVGTLQIAVKRLEIYVITAKLLRAL